MKVSSVSTKSEGPIETSRHVGRLDKDTNQTLSKSLIQVGENTQRVKKILSAEVAES